MSRDSSCYPPQAQGGKRRIEAQRPRPAIACAPLTLSLPSFLWFFDFWISLKTWIKEVENIHCELPWKWRVKKLIGIINSYFLPSDVGFPCYFPFSFIYLFFLLLSLIFSSLSFVHLKRENKRIICLLWNIIKVTQYKTKVCCIFSVSSCLHSNFFFFTFITVKITKNSPVWSAFSQTRRNYKTKACSVTYIFRFFLFTFRFFCFTVLWRWK